MNANAQMTLAEAQRAGITEPCNECKSPILVGSEGICYKCQCELHEIGAFDMDNDPWNGSVEPRRNENDYYDEDKGIPPTFILPPGVAEIIETQRQQDEFEIPF